MFDCATLIGELPTPSTVYPLLMDAGAGERGSDASHGPPSDGESARSTARNESTDRHAAEDQKTTDGEQHGAGHSRRRFLERAVLGGSGVLAGVTAAGVLAGRTGVLGETADVESVRGAVAAAASFELETAWLHETGDRTTTVPRQSTAQFPALYQTEAAPQLRFDDLDPGSSGRLLGAFRLVGAPGEVRCAGRLSGSEGLAELIEIECWHSADWDLTASGHDEVLFSGPLSAFPSEPVGATECIEPKTPSGVGLAYRLPELEAQDRRRAVEGASLDFVFELIATQC